MVDEIIVWFLAGFSKLEPVVQALGRSPGRLISNHVITYGVVCSGVVPLSVTNPFVVVCFPLKEKRAHTRSQKKTS